MESGKDHRVDVEEAKARLRAAAIRCDPGRLISEHPLASVAAAAAAGMGAAQPGMIRSMAFKAGSWAIRSILQGMQARNEEE